MIKRQKATNNCTQYSTDTAQEWATKTTLTSSTCKQRPSWPWSYVSWIYNYLWNRCLSPLVLWIRVPLRARSTTLCDKVCQWLAAGRWFSPGHPVSSTNKTDRHHITEILLKVALNTIKPIKKQTRKQIQIYILRLVYLMFPVSYDCPFLTALSVFSNVYLSNVLANLDDFTILCYVSHNGCPISMCRAWQWIKNRTFVHHHIVVCCLYISTDDIRSKVSFITNISLMYISIH